MKDNIIKNTTCFTEHKNRNLCCKKNQCKNWMDHEGSLNCAVIGASKGKWILRDIGAVFNVTFHVVNQVPLRREFKLTSLKFASEKFLFQMDAHVGFEIAVFSEVLMTNFTIIWFDTCMGALVNLQSALSGM